MKNSEQGFVIPIVIGLGVVVSIAAGVFIYTRTTTSHVDTSVATETVVDTSALDRAKADLAAKTARLNALAKSVSPGVVSSGYETAAAVMVRSETLLSKIPAPTNIVRARIESERSRILGILASWKTSDTSFSSAQQYKTALLQYLGDLSSVVAGLSTQGSGLSDADISSYKLLLADLSKQVADALTDVPPEVKKQQQIVTEAQVKVDILESELPPSSEETPVDNGSGSNTVIPPTNSEGDPTIGGGSIPTLIPGTDPFPWQR